MKEKLYIFLILSIFLFLTAFDTVQEDEKNTIAIGYSHKVFLDVNKSDAEALTSVLTKDLLKQKKLKKLNKTEIFYNIKDISEKIRQNIIDLVVINVFDYFELRKLCKINPVLAAIVDYEEHYEYIILTKKNHKLNKIEDLKGHSVYFHSIPGDSTIYYWLNYEINKNKGISLSDYFSSIKQVSKSNQAILPVFFGQADACVVSKKSFKTACLLNPQLEKELKIILKSQSIPWGIICIRSNLGEDEYRSLTINTLKELHLDSKGKQILDLFKVAQLVDLKPEDIEYPELLYSNSKSLQNSKLIKKSEKK